MTLSWPGLASVAARLPPRAPDATAPVAPTRYDRIVAGEWRTLALVPRLLARAPELGRAPRGDGSLVVDVPGWRSPEAVLAPLRAFLRGRGYEAMGWGFGINRGDPEQDAVRLAEKVAAAAKARGGPVSLVGWSLGGVVAREVARAVPEAVRRVITFGTPVLGGPTYTIGARTVGEAECRRITALVDELDRTRPITVPITAIFTRSDHVVNWPACIDRRSPDVEHVEVASTHLGMTVDPEVWSIIAQRLARPVASPAG